MKRLLQWLTLPLIFMQNYEFNTYDSAFLPNYSGGSGGHNHRTPTACFNNKVTKRRNKNKIARASRKINFR